MRPWITVVMIFCATHAFCTQPSRHFLRTCRWYGLDDSYGKLDIGFSGGPGLSQIGGLTATLSSGSLRSNYQWQYRLTAGAQAYLYGLYQQGYLGVEAGLIYYNINSKIDKVYTTKTETYSFINHYIGAQIVARIFLYKGFYMAAGGRFGYNLTPKDIKYYSSWFKDYSGDEFQVQNRLQSVLSGKTTYGVLLKMGYDFLFGLNFNIEYFCGLSDAYSAIPNKYDIVEQTNPTYLLVFTIGYNINIFDHETGRKEPAWQQWEN